MRKDAGTIFDPSAFGIGSRIIESSDTGVRDCPRAHRAGLERHPHIAIRESIRSQYRASGADGHDLGMRCRIVSGARGIGSGRDELASVHDDGTDGDFANR